MSYRTQTPLKWLCFITLDLPNVILIQPHLDATETENNENKLLDNKIKIMESHCKLQKDPHEWEDSCLEEIPTGWNISEQSVLLSISTLLLEHIVYILHVNLPT